MPLYIAQSGDLEGCHACLTDWLTTLKDRATQLLIKFKTGALVTQWACSLISVNIFWQSVWKGLWLAEDVRKLWWTWDIFLNWNIFGFLSGSNAWHASYMIISYHWHHPLIWSLYFTTFLLDSRNKWVGELDFNDNCRLGNYQSMNYCT